MVNKNIDKNKQLVYAVWVNDGDISYVYLGSGKHERLSGNGSKLRRNVHDNKTLQEAYNIVNKFHVETLEFNIEDDEKARDIEEMYIEHFKRIDNVIVCNKYPTYASEYKRKLDEDDVKFIRELIAKGKTNKEIAERFNVDPSTISRIKTKKRWGGVC
ncbi:hypothetical protein CBE01nite_29780 [Clostridium beijerinckii]|uniref:Helix-turn-helix domain-containing protein n=1 Tax=Clostridium beijerinckii TaxID=1520 RepID=A0AB74VD92_CLOBE|nr:helix-turn-helix domain-containing protein [Clostridium beijerinckii]NRZ28758.1 hypothetical protein [Clostridium beijerinckii]NYB95466.1 hypothetical protein [Clostridium beijerinckii]OOM24581.1 hypothetical protein CLBEI_20420 [Clostridium beijerinckii]QUN34436.1 helix-turn-helix domain-containing protein [Clostridium beijerinckii]SQB00610.1 Uncharacterised protein [Clostridium beijerinckii]